MSDKRYETPTAATLFFEIPGWSDHHAGQHVDIRLTARDGYQATRSYSLASAPGEPPAITVDRVDGGEVSPFLVDVALAGTPLDVRGPIGGYFVWKPGSAESVVLMAGGSGIVPLRSMLRHRRRVGDPAVFSLIYSVRAVEQIIYRSELEESAPGETITFTLTGSDVPDTWPGEVGHVNLAMIEKLAPAAAGLVIAYVCGPTPFVETAASLLVGSGYDPLNVRTERFG